MTLLLEHRSLADLLADKVQKHPDLFDGLSELQLQELLYDWDFWARPNQKMPPLNDWIVWLIMTGRGWGKTLTGAQTVCHLVKQDLIGNIALVAQTPADARDVMVDELHRNSGILTISRPDFMPTYSKSNRRLVWPNGAVANIYSAEDPDQLRGPQHDFAWVDELASFPHYSVDLVWSNLMFGLRKGLSKVVVTTTPRPIKLIKDLIKRGTTYVTRGSTYENIRNLSKTYVEVNIKPYEGTRLGRQELDAEILEELEGAFWTHELIDAARIHPEDFTGGLTRIEVAVDPAGSVDGHEIGIAGGGVKRIGSDLHGYLLADRSMRGSPLQWATAAIQLYDELEADAIVCERNYGGDMVASTIKLVAQTLDHEPIHVKEVNATRGKIVRAEPISGLSQQRRIHHVGGFSTLEDQLCDMSPGTANDRSDAYVWLFTSLMGKSVMGIPSPDHESMLAAASAASKRPSLTQLGGIWNKQW